MLNGVLKRQSQQTIFLDGGGLMIRVALITLLVSCPFFSQAQNTNNEMRSHFRQFFANFQRAPEATMNTLPVKYDSNGNVVQDHALFSAAEIQDNNFVSLKDKVRAKITYDPSALMLAQIDQANQPASLLEGSHQTNMAFLAAPNMSTGTVLNQPWSSDYWATYRGGLSYRYTKFGNLPDWLSYKAIFNRLIGVNFTDPVANDDRSPAEKYDMLMGDDNFNFTKYWVRKSISAENRNGEVETWQGICHGWAPASYMMPRPTKAISFHLSNGTDLRFFPDDLKGLADALYANNKTSSAFVGTRCNVKNPATDDVGRITSPGCWDINPGSFHTILVNRVGVDKRSLVMDATYDYEVWNQPIVGYHAAYFNPQTGEWTDSYRDAMVSSQNFTNDHFKKYRSPNAAYVVGVQMDVTYTVETYSEHYFTNSPQNDVLRTAEYMYDLELDNSGNIIGGEWYHNAHPDFMWSPTFNAQPLAFGEPVRMNAWDANGLPSAQAKIMAPTSSGSGQLINAVIQKLMQISSQ